MLSNSSMNTAHYKSPAFDSIMAETLKVTDEAQRTALYTKAEQQLDKDSAIVPGGMVPEEEMNQYLAKGR